MSKKLETIIHRANGGNHHPVNYRKHMNMLLDHPYSIGLLYHIVFTGSEDPKVYRKAVELLCKQLRANGMPCRYKACYERDKFKRFHKHVFILIEAKESHPDTIIHFRKGHWFTKMTESLGLGFKIAQPQDAMHQVASKKVNYAYVPKKASPKLEDCLLWISYLTKVRSKEGVECQVYTGSTNREGKKPNSPIAALPAAKVENISAITEEVIFDKAVGNSLAPSAFYPIQETTPSSRSIRLEGEDNSAVQATGGSKQDYLVDTKQLSPIGPLMGQPTDTKGTSNETSSTETPSQASPGEADSLGGGSSRPVRRKPSTGTESPASSPGSSSSGPILVSPGCRPRVPAPSTSPSPEAIRPGQAHGGAAGPAGEADLQITHYPGDNAMLTTAQKYIASRYEEAVDLRLDVGAVRRYLLARGIKRTPDAVVFDLEHRYGFYGYASNHPAPAEPDLDAIDRAIDRMRNSDVKRLAVPPISV